MVDENGSKWAIRIWVDEKDFNNKNTTFAANWISQAQSKLKDTRKILCPILTDLESTGSVTLSSWTSKEFFEKATIFMKKTIGAVAKKDLWIELRTSFKLLYKLKKKEEYESHLRIIMEIIKPFQGEEIGHFVVAAIIGAIEPINREVSTSLRKMVKDQMFSSHSSNEFQWGIEGLHRQIFYCSLPAK